MASKAETKKTATTGETLRNLGFVALAVFAGALAVEAAFSH